MSGFAEQVLHDEVEDLYVEQNLQQIKQLGAAGLTTREIWAHFARPQPDPACKACGLDQPMAPGPRATALEACTHGGPLWARADGTPIPLRTMQRIIAKVRARWREERLAERAGNRERNLLTTDLILRGALEAGQPGIALAAARFRAELDGSYVAAEEAARPGLHARVLALAARVSDFALPQDLAPRAPEGTPSLWRFRLLRLERLLLACDESAARFRRLGEPPEGEALRRQWLARMNAEGAHQRATFPGVDPGKRFEDVNKAAFTGGAIADNVILGELAEQVDALTAELSKGGEKKADE